MDKKYPVVLTIAGSDSSGGAGIQADIKAMSALGAYAASAITAITAQNTLGVTAIQGITPEVVAKQIDAVFTDLHPLAVKIGMLFSGEIVEAVADRLSFYQPAYIVLDPVMISTSGSKLIGEEAIECMKTRLFPLSTLLTPNKLETEHLTGIRISDSNGMEKAAAILRAQGCRNVLIKGGHFNYSDMTDFLFDSKGNKTEFHGKFIDTLNTHGTGCTLSSAIASFLALSKPLEEAIRLAKNYLQEALEQGADIKAGSGHGPMNHFYNPKKLTVLS